MRSKPFLFFLTEVFSAGAVDLCGVVAVLALDVEDEAVGAELLLLLALDVALEISKKDSSLSVRL